MTIGAYLYLAFINPQWPLSASPPALAWSSGVTIVMVLSVWPNMLAKVAAKHEDLRAVRRDLVIMSAVGLLLIMLRFLEFGALHVRWDENAYGSVVWLLLGLHTTHIITDVGDTLVLTVLMFTKHGQGRRFSDVEDNAFYWNFVVLSWLPIYALLYWGPRL
jgi:heme/copper-type cytochrome/quinol oxidase subunit 3